ncbi:MAG TPA: hypothetical protein VKB41_14285 [Steroidobacteraceae bacterium]|nr:hypothetical protein [Steroidobacteraceae bacterium]
MTGSKPPKPDKPGAAAPESKPADEKTSGRVTFDSRGNAVWEWSMATGKFGADINTERLKKLYPDLKIQEDKPQTPKSFGTNPEQRGPGFDPYNTHAQRPAQTPPRDPASGSDPYNNTSAPPPEKKRATKPKDLRRLSEWITKQRGPKKDEK